MTMVSHELLLENQKIEKKLGLVADTYMTQKDVRWMFAYAHFRITQQINASIVIPGLFRDPNQLIRFNVSFATAFLAAVAAKPAYPWKQAFMYCAMADFYFDPPIPIDIIPSLEYPTDHQKAVTVCSVAMADAHINTDIVNSLRTVGCIDVYDYANILPFVEIGARDAIYKLHGKLSGWVFDQLKQMLLPLDEIWRNNVYQQVCGISVPDPEPLFMARVELYSRSMVQIVPSPN